MNKILALLFAFVLCTTSVFAQTAGEAQTINNGGGPQYLQQDAFPSISVSPVRALSGAIIVGSTGLTTATSLASFGGTTFSIVAGGTSNAVGSDGNWINAASNASSTSSAIFQSSGNYPIYTQSPRIIATIKIGPNASDITNCRIWFGLTNSYSNVQNSDTPTTTTLAAFRYAPATDGTAFWRCITGSGTTLTTITTTTAITIDTAYTLAVDVSNAGVVYFYINGALVGTSTTNLPNTAAVLAAPVFNVTTLNAVAKNIKLKVIYEDYL